jgi:hypothetical protein
MKNFILVWKNKRIILAEKPGKHLEVQEAVVKIILIMFLIIIAN